jgi:hypothetical protein
VGSWAPPAAPILTVATSAKESSEAVVRLRFKLALAFIFVLAMPGWSPARSLAQATLPARLSVLHVSPDAPALDVYVDGTRSLTGLAFSQASAYIGLLPGSHQIQVTPTTRLDVLLATAATFEAGRSYTWVLSGVILAADLNPPATQDLQFPHYIQLIDNAGPAPDPRARLRVVNASPGAGPLDVRVSGPASTTLAASLGYGGVSLYASIPDGSYAVSVYPPGGSTALATIPGVELQPQSAYTLVLAGVLPGKAAANPPNMVRGFQAVLLTDQTSARLQPLPAGCNQVVLNVAVGTTFASVLGYITDPGQVISIWRVDSALKLLEVGFFQDAQAPVDNPVTLSSPELIFICVTGGTSWNPPT